MEDRDDQSAPRACIRCPAVYEGRLICPDCGEPGEPLEGLCGEWWLYVLRCADGSLYCGVSLDVARRLRQHRAGSGAKYTRGRGPLSLVAVRGPYLDRGAAQAAEARFKRLGKAKKEREVLSGYVLPDSEPL